MELCRHLKKDFELVDLRAVLGRRDIEFDQPIYGLFTGLFANAEVSRLAAGRADAAGLKAELVETAMLRASPS